MCSRQPSLSAARVVSLSTEHLNHGVFGRDPNNFAHVSDEPCPCQNHIRLQQHTSHWQYAGRSPQSRRKTSSAAPAAVRSDSATAVPRDPSGDVCPQQKPSLCDSLHALTILKPTSSRCPLGMRDFDHLPFVPCSSATTVRTGGGCSAKPYSVTTASRYQSAAYELSDDLRAKEVEFIERTYGGRLRAQHAARVIQAKYRDYRMRAQYDRLRSSRRPPRQHDDLGSSTTFCSNDLPLSREHLASMEDLVLDRAYLDWESEVANGSIVDLTATQSNRASAPSACVADRGQSDEAVSATATVVPTTATASCSSLVATARHPQHCHQFSSASASSGSPGTATGSTSGFVSSPGSCSSSGSLSNEPPKAGTVATTGDPSASYTDIAATASPMPPPRQQQHIRTLSNPPPVLATAAAAASSPASSKPSLKSHVQQLVPASHAVDDMVPHHRQYSQSSMEQSPCAYYLLDNLVTTERTPASSQVYVAVPLNQEPPSSQQQPQLQQQQQYHQQNQRDNYKYLRVVCPAGQTLPAAPVLAQPAVLVRRSSLGSNSSNTPPSSAPTRPTTSSAAATPIWCTPDGKMYTLAYAATSTAASTAVGAPPTESRIALVPQAVNSVGGEPRRVVHSQSLNHSQSAQQQQQVLLVRRQACDNTNHPHRVLHATAVSSTPVQRCQVVKPLVASVDVMRDGSAAALQQQQHQPILVKVHPPGLVAASPAATTTSATARESPASADRSRKRMYRVCLNYFNKSPVKGINMLIKYRFLETSPRQIARFLLSRRGLSRSAIGEYLGEMKDDLAKATTRQFMRELDFRDKDVDEALRTLMSRFRTPGESQKIVHLLTEFQSAYVEQNPARVKAQFQNPDSVMILAYAIVMLHTDLYSPSIRPQAKMTGQEFVKNLRGIDDGEDLDRNLLLSIYNRIQAQEMSVLPDHTDQVRKIQRLLTGPLTPPSLVMPQRRLVCYCRLYEVPDRNKRDRAGAHEREIFLFNDLLLVTKAFQKRRKDAPYVYQVRACVNLLGLRVSTFETAAYPNGIALYKSVTSTATAAAAASSDSAGSCLPFERALSSAPDKKSPSPAAASGRSSSSSSPPPVACLNTKTIADRMRLVDDLQECILEAAEMDRIRLEEVLSKQQELQRPQKPSCTAGGGAGGGGVKRIESDLSSASSASQKASGQSATPQSQCALCTCMTEPLLMQSQSASQQKSAAYKCSGTAAYAYRSPPSRLVDQHRGF